MGWSDCADAQAGLRLCCLQTSEDRFSRVEAHIWVIIMISHILSFQSASTGEVCEFVKYGGDE